MKSIKELIQTAKPKATNSERAELIGYFHGKVNADRGGRRPIPVRAIAVKLAHLSIADLYYLRSICEDAERRGTPWSKVFWGSLHVKE